MKKLIIIALVLLTAASCSKSPEKAAQKLIKQEIKANLGDPKTYEPVGFGTLDSVFTDVYSSYEYTMAKAKFEACMEVSDDYSRDSEWERVKGNYTEALRLNGEAKALLDTAAYWMERKKAVLKSFVPQFKGYKMTHSFRAELPLVGKSKTDMVFYFDPELTKITKKELI